MKRGEPVTEARLEAALMQSATIAAADPRYRPIYDRIERELIEVRLTSPEVRARELVRRD